MSFATYIHWHGIIHVIILENSVITPVTVLVIVLVVIALRFTTVSSSFIWSRRSNVFCSSFNSPGESSCQRHLRYGSVHLLLNQGCHALIYRFLELFTFQKSNIRP